MSTGKASGTHQWQTELSRLSVLLVAGAIARIALLWWFQGQPLYVQDEQSYDAIAQNLVARGEFALRSGTLTSIRPPLYPLFVSAVYRVFGSGNYQAVRIAQAVISLILVVMLYYLASELFSPTVGIGAAGLLCFYPSLLWSTCLLLTETLFAFWLLAMSICLIWYFKTGRPWLLVVVGISLGLGALTRSVLWLFPPFLSAFLLVAERTGSWRRRVVVAAIPLLAFAVTILPWSVRNTRLHKTFVTIDVMGGRNFMMGNYEHTPLFRAWDAISISGPHAWYSVLLRDEPTARRTQGQIDKLAMQRTIRYVLSHPVLTAQRCVVKFFNFWQLERCIVAGVSRNWWGLGGPFVKVSVAVLVSAFYGTTMSLGIVGFVMLRPHDVRMHWFLLLMVGFVCALHTITFGHSRYHLPLMPFVCVYAAAAVTCWPRIWRNRRSVQFCAAMLICVVLVGAWFTDILYANLSQMQGFVAARRRCAHLVGWTSWSVQIIRTDEDVHPTWVTAECRFTRSATFEFAHLLPSPPRIRTMDSISWKDLSRIRGGEGSGVTPLPPDTSRSTPKRKRVVYREASGGEGSKCATSKLALRVTIAQHQDWRGGV